ncbi:MAG: hypothetical protein JXX14_14585 [Deltaproteobacteria bacterium]|nr:hypothetical protein [Deltaproteobacteria bacterium]
MKNYLLLVCLWMMMTACSADTFDDGDTLDDTNSESTSDSDSDTDSDSDVDSDIDSDTDSDSDSDSDTDADSDSDTDSDTDSDSDSDTDTDSDSNTDTDSGWPGETDSDTASDTAVDSAAESDDDSDVGPNDDCIAAGAVTYTLSRADNPTAEQQEMYSLITAAMDLATYYYNCYTSITKSLTVEYNPGVSTADGNYNGNIRFGRREYMQVATAMHEIAHTVGIGTTSQYQSMFSGAVFTGETTTNLIREIENDPAAEVHGDSQHFWPYGLNYESEYETESDLINHCKIVQAILTDCGLL